VQCGSVAFSGVIQPPVTTAMNGIVQAIWGRPRAANRSQPPHQVPQNVSKTRSASLGGLA